MDPTTRRRSERVFLWVLVLFFLVNLTQIYVFRSLLAGGAMTLKKQAYFLVSVGSASALWLLFLVRLRLRGPLLGWFLFQGLYQYVNLAYFDFFNTCLTLSAAVATLGNGVSLAGGQALPLDLRRHGFLLAGLPLLALLAYLHPAGRSLLQRLPRRARGWLLAPLGLGLALSLGVGALWNRDLWQFTLMSDVVSAFGLPVYQVGHYLRWERNPEALQRQLVPSGRVVQGVDQGWRRSIAVIQVESMGSDVLALEQGGAPLMPFLRRLSGEALHYPQMLTYHRGGGTSDIEFTCISSLQPLKDYPAISVPVDYGNSFLWKLRAAGFTTVAYHGNHGGFWNRSWAFPRMGFERFVDARALGLKSEGWGIPDHAVADALLRDRPTGSRPSLRYFITMSSHGPYAQVQQYFPPPFPQGSLSREEWNYRVAMRYVDGQLEKLVRQLQAQGTGAIFIFGDHTDHYTPLAKRASPRAWVRSEEDLLEFTPLFILGPDLPRRGTQAEAAGLLDLAPTILAASGVPYTLLTEGEDLLGTQPPAREIPYNGHSYSRARLAALAASGRSGSAEAGGR